MTDGALYVAEGPDYAALAVQSLRTLRQQEPDLPVHIATDQPGLAAHFDAVHPIPTASRRAKIAAMAASPFDRTLFLDCDTLVVGPLSDGFALLDRFPLALTHDVRRSSALIETGWQADAPATFPQHNSGVMFYRKAPETDRFFADWARAYDTAGKGRDQVTLRDILWDSDLRFWVLPPEWNLRRVTELDAWEPLDAIPRIIHSHQLVRHLRGGGAPVTTLEEILTLERTALAGEWRGLETRAPSPDLADPALRFAHARRHRTE